MSADAVSSEPRGRGSRRAPRWLLWSGVVLAIGGTPLATLPGAFNEFAPIKALVLALATTLIALGLLLDAEAHAVLTAVVRRSPIVWAAAAGVAVASLATVASVAPRSSLIGNYPDYRGLALVVATVMTGAGSVVITARGIDTRWIARLASVVVLVVSVLALPERLFESQEQLVDNVVRVVSSLGNSSNLGLFLAIALPLLALPLFDRTELAAWRLLSAAATGLGLITLVWTSSRGAWLGLFVAAAVWVVLTVAARSGRGRLRFALVAFAVTAALVTTAVLATPKALERLTSIGDLASQSAQARASIWRSSVRMTSARPLLGYGPSTFLVAYPPFREAGAADGRHGYQVTEAAHNLFLDSSTSAGLLGLAASLALVLLTGRGVVRWRRAADRPQDSAAVTASLMAALVGLQFHYVTMDTGPLIAALAGIVASREVFPNGRAEASSVPGLESGANQHRAWRILLTACVAIGLVTVLLFGAVTYVDRRMSALADRVTTGAPWSATRGDARLALRLSVVDPFAARVLLRLASAAPGDPADADRARYAETALRLATSAEPRDPTVWAETGEYWLAVAGTRDTRSLAKADAAFARAVRLDPENGVPLVGVARVLMREGRYVDAVPLLERALALSVRYKDGWAVLAEAYAKTGDAASAEKAQRTSDLLKY